MANMRVAIKIVVYKDSKKEWRWKMIKNYRIVADSGEGYKRKSTLIKTLINILDAIDKDDFLVTDEQGVLI